MVRNVLVALAFAAAVSTGVFLYLAEKREHAQAAKELSILQSQVRALLSRSESESKRPIFVLEKSDIESASIASVAPTGSVEFMPSAVASDVAPVPLSFEERAFQEQQALDAAAGRYEKIMLAEGVDRTWSAETVALIRSNLTHSPATKVISTDCARSLCRVVVEHDGPRDREGMVNAIADLPPFSAGTVYRDDPSVTDRSRTIMYVGRERGTL
jgi:hypothetical protein